jgi:MtN3 and saliva related transmembrane protein
MPETAVVAIGFIAGTLTTASFLPQVIQTIKTRKTKDLSLGMYTALSVGVFLWLIYGIALNSPPVYLTNGITFILASVILYLKIKHG